jgi:uncharacterized membrane protein
MSTAIKTEKKKESLLFLLLSHHRADKLHRTIHLRIGQRDLYLCARGVGRYSGLVAAFIMNGFLGIPLWLYPYGFVFFPLPSTMDWATQKIGLRESRNSIRVSTGFLLGVSQGLLIISFLKGLRPTTQFGVGVLIIYFLCFCIARYWNRGST